MILPFPAGKRIIAEVRNPTSRRERDEIDKVAVKPFFLRHATKSSFSHRNDGVGPCGSPWCRKARPGKTYNAQNALERLRKHALDFAADETGSTR